jgi:CDGSH-type Zn-finger protein
MAATKDHGPKRWVDPRRRRFRILDQDGKAFGLGGRTSIGLCRCGHSQTKPFCDGAHKKLIFRASSKRATCLPPRLSKP